MQKYTVKQFANLEGISQQAVYKRIKSKSLKSVKEGGKTFIFSKPTSNRGFESQEPKHDPQSRAGGSELVDVLQTHIKDLQEQVKAKDEQIKSQNNQLMMAMSTTMDANKRLEGYQQRFGMIENSGFKSSSEIKDDTVTVPVEEVEQEEYTASPKKKDKSKGKRFEKKKKDKKKKKK
jgi:hypothetical protein